jgi:ATP/maltotriose-dependent transcriptional regulator MalT
LEVLKLLTQVLGNRDVGAILHVTENTVEYHMRHLLLKLSARNRLEAVQRAASFGLA